MGEVCKRKQQRDEWENSKGAKKDQSWGRKVTSILRKLIRKKDRNLLDEMRDEPCLVCKHTPSDPCHIKSKGAGGEDSYENVVPLCRVHHRLQHTVGWNRFARTHPTVLKALEARGWELCEHFGISKLSRREPDDVA